MKKTASFFVIILLAMLVLPLESCRGGDDNGGLGISYDVIKINGVNYACYGYKYVLQTASCWEPSDIEIRCQEVSSIKKYGDYDYDFYSWIFHLEFPYEMVPKKGMKLQDYNLTYRYYSSDGDVDSLYKGTGKYKSGTAIVTAVAVGRYVTVKFDDYTFDLNGQPLTINGTVQLTDAYTDEYY